MIFDVIQNHYESGETIMRDPKYFSIKIDQMMKVLKKETLK